MQICGAWVFWSQGPKEKVRLSNLSRREKCGSKAGEPRGMEVPQRAPRKVKGGKLPTGVFLPQKALSLVGRPEAPPGWRERRWGGQVASPGWGSPSSSWFCFSSLILCRQRRRNLIIFRAAWSCFLVRKEPLLRAGRGPEGRWGGPGRRR